MFKNKDIVAFVVTLVACFATIALGSPEGLFCVIVLAFVYF